MTEIWKTVSGFTDYSVSNFGRICSSKKRRSRILICGKNSAGYRHLQVNPAQFLMVHRIVAIEFIPNPNGHAFINHIDGEKENNRVENLEWVSSSQNRLHAIHVLKRPMATGLRHGAYTHPESRRIGQKNGRAKITQKDVESMRTIFAAGGKTKQAIADQFKISRTQTSRILSGAHWKPISTK